MLLGNDPQGRPFLLQGPKLFFHLICPVNVIQDELLKGAAGLFEALQQLQDTWAPHAVVTEVQFPQAAVGQQDIGKAAATTICHITVSQPKLTQHCIWLAQGLAKLLDSLVSQWVAAHLQLQQRTAFGQHGAEVGTGGSCEATGLYPQ